MGASELRCSTKMNNGLWIYSTLNVPTECAGKATVVGGPMAGRTVQMYTSNCPSHSYSRQWLF